MNDHLFWPLTLLTVLLIFRPPLIRLIDRITGGKVAVSKSGLNIEFIVASSAAHLGAAVATRSRSFWTDDGQMILETVAPAAERAARHFTALRHSRVLWVDDNPSNNLYERQAISALGIQFDLALNSVEALNRLKENTYRLIISDFSRKDEPEAGYALLAKVRELASPPPIIIYSSASNPEFKREAKSRGAFDQTNKPVELYGLVVKAIIGDAVGT